MSGEPRGAHEGGGRTQEGAPPASCLPRCFPYVDPSLLDCFHSKNKFREVSGQLDSV